MTRKLHLVLIEDNPADGEIIARHLERAGQDSTASYIACRAAPLWSRRSRKESRT